MDARNFKASWDYAFYKYEDGKTKNIHFLTVHITLATNDRTSYFSGEPFHCKFCFREGVIVREDNYHIAILCINTYNFQQETVIPILRSISGEHAVSLEHTIFGRPLGRRNIDATEYKRYYLYNYVVHTAQRALWQSRNAFNNGNRISDVKIILGISY